MSYDIHIGEADVEGCLEDDEYWARVTVVGKSDENAPCFAGDGMTGNGNSRHPGYRQWADFCRRNGLYELFYAEWEGLLKPHPGCKPLKKEHLEKVKESLKKLEETDKRPPGLDPRYIEDSFAEIPAGEETHSYDKVRLIWMVWWMEWALKNCEHPAVANR